MCGNALLHGLAVNTAITPLGGPFHTTALAIPYHRKLLFLLGTLHRLPCHKLAGANSQDFYKTMLQKYPILCIEAFYSWWNFGGGTPDIVTTSSCDDEKKGGAGSWTLDRNQQLEVPRLFFCRSMQVSIPYCSNMQEQDSGTMDRVCNLLEAFFLQINIPKLTNKVIL